MSPMHTVICAFSFWTLSLFFSFKHTHTVTLGLHTSELCACVHACLFVCVLGWPTFCAWPGLCCCCAVLLWGRSLQTPPEKAPALLLTDTHRGMLNPRGLETSASLSARVWMHASQIHFDADAQMNTYKNACTQCTDRYSITTHLYMLKHIFKAHTVRYLYIFNSIHPPPAPPPLFPVFVWSYCFNLAASGGPWRL